MGTSHVDCEDELRVPADKAYKALLAVDELFPKIMPQAFKKFEIIQGDGGVGTIKNVTFGEGVPYKNGKLRIDAVDHGNLSYSFTFIEGPVLQGAESLRNDTKIIPSGGGCIMKQKITRHTKGNTPLTADEIKEAKDNATMSAKAVESYLLQNPTAY